MHVKTRCMCKKKMQISINYINNTAYPVDSKDSLWMLFWFSNNRIFICLVHKIRVDKSQILLGIVFHDCDARCEMTDCPMKYCEIFCLWMRPLFNEKQPQIHQSVWRGVSAYFWLSYVFIFGVFNFFFGKLLSYVNECTRGAVHRRSHLATCL